MTLNRVIL